MGFKWSVWATIAAAGLGVFRAIDAGHPILAQEKSQWDGVYVKDQAMRGEGLYAKYCANCHGTDLSGGDLAPGLIGSEFDANWNDLSLGQLFERMKTSMPQDSPDSLSRQQNADILAFLLDKSGAPAGTSALPIEVEILKTIKFKAAKP
jgi:mono/diheme cytochrome c family protein